ncbi:MAG: hypothetical protein NVV59_17870 [Chitinophagaceae bacterium]|nr:hypothetical protein [Chitinophagaceae bacterium]
MKKASKSMSGVSDKQLAAAWEDETRIVPKKNTTRIAAIPNVSKQAMSAYLKAAHAEVIKALPASVVDYAEKVYAFCVQSNISAERMSTVSAGFWMEGKTGIAVYLLGKALTQTNEAEVRGNYAALLSMMDAPHIAIPVLNVLNAEFPKNSTLLNNLGQAWFGLGELVKAEKYLDSAIAIYPYHPQANLTKARIEESKGNPKKAVECVKRSIKHAYTKEKEETLKRLGYKITMNDLSYHFKADTDPLSIGKFKRPEYPRNAQELKALAPIWQEFNDELTMEIAKLEKEKRDQSQKVNENTQQMVAQAMKLVQKRRNGSRFYASAPVCHKGWSRT